MRPDLVVLVSGDSDFVPVVLELRNKGIRVEIAAFGHSMSGLLRHRCSGYINLDVLVDESMQDIPMQDELGQMAYHDEYPAEPEPVVVPEEPLEGELVVVDDYELPQSGSVG